jgi:hypothetical protein
MQEDLFSTYCGYLQFFLPTSLFTFFSSLTQAFTMGLVPSIHIGLSDQGSSLISHSTLTDLSDLLDY